MLGREGDSAGYSFSRSDNLCAARLSSAHTQLAEHNIGQAAGQYNCQKQSEKNALNIRKSPPPKNGCDRVKRPASDCNPIGNSQGPRIAYVQLRMRAKSRGRVITDQRCGIAKNSPHTAVKERVANSHDTTGQSRHDEDGNDLWRS